MLKFISSIYSTSTSWGGDPEFTQLLPNIKKDGDFRYVTAALTKVRYYNGLFYIIFFFKSAHTAQVGGTLMHIYKLNPNGSAWEFISIIDLTDPSIPIYGGGFDIMPNGDFLLGVELVGVEYRIYRSSDNGLSWVAEKIAISLTNGYSPVGLFSTGTSVLMGVIASPPQIMRNTTPNGVNGNWYIFDMPNGNNIGGSPAEPNFIKLATGEIVVIYRRDIGVLVDNPGTPLYSVSNDDGATWSDLAYCNVDNFYRTNISLIHNKRDKTIEIIACARTQTSAGRGTTWYSVTTEDNIKNGNLGTPIAIGDGSAGQDFGNQGANISPDDGTLVLAYVDLPEYGYGALGSAEMYTYVGKRTNSGNPITLPKTF